MIQDYIIIHILIVLWCVGLRTVTDEGKIGWPIRRWLLDNNLPSYIKKPILLCVACMSSFWGQLIFWLYVYVQNINITIITILLAIFISTSASFFNDVLWTNYEVLKLKKKALDR